MKQVFLYADYRDDGIQSSGCFGYLRESLQIECSLRAADGVKEYYGVGFFVK